MNNSIVTLTARGILFDMDGTLVDSTAVVEGVWAEFCEEFGLDLRAVLAMSHGRRTLDTVRLFAPPSADAEAISHGIVAKEMSRTDGVVEIAGAGALMKSLPAGVVGLVTSAPADLSRIRMDAAGIRFPAVTVFGEDITHGKPSPDCYLLGASKLGIDPTELIAFEDAPAGITAAVSAGLRTIVVGGYRGAEAEGLTRIADYTGVRLVRTDDAADGAGVTLTLEIA